MQLGDRSALQGRTIWVTRPREQADRLCSLLEESGAHAVRFPVIEIKPPEQKPDPETIVRLLDDAQLLVFVSVNAVRYAVSVMPGFFAQPGDRQVLALGQATRQALNELGIDQATSVSGIGSDALLDAGLINPANLKGKRVLVIRGSGGRETIINYLESNGITVDCLEVYRRDCPVIDHEYVDKLWQESPPDALVVTSVEGLHNLIKMVGETSTPGLRQVPLAVMSERIGSRAAELGFSCMPGIATESSDQGLIDAIEKIVGAQK